MFSGHFFYWQSAFFLFFFSGLGRVFSGLGQQNFPAAGVLKKNDQISISFRYIHILFSAHLYIYTHTNIDAHNLVQISLALRHVVSS